MEAEQGGYLDQPTDIAVRIPIKSRTGLFSILIGGKQAVSFVNQNHDDVFWLKKSFVRGRINTLNIFTNFIFRDIHDF